MFQAIDMHVYRRALRARDCICYLRVTEDYSVDVTYTKNCRETSYIYEKLQRDKTADIYHSKQEKI